MPKYYCDYCDIFLTHDSPSVRKAHNSGWKHRAQVRQYYAQFENAETQSMIDSIVGQPGPPGGLPFPPMPPGVAMPSFGPGGMPFPPFPPGASGMPAMPLPPGGMIRPPGMPMPPGMPLPAGMPMPSGTLASSAAPGLGGAPQNPESRSDS